MINTIDAISQKYVVDEVRGCWLWKTSPSQEYGYLSWQGKRSVRAHRLIYEIHRGPIPNGLVLDHLCRTKNCVNPFHLEPVSQAVNVARGMVKERNSGAKKAHCKHGHQLFGENLVLIDTKTRGVERACRECLRERNRSSRRKKRLAQSNDTQEEC